MGDNMEIGCVNHKITAYKSKHQIVLTDENYSMIKMYLRNRCLVIQKKAEEQKKTMFLLSRHMSNANAEIGIRMGKSFCDHYKLCNPCDTISCNCTIAAYEDAKKVYFAFTGRKFE